MNTVHRSRACLLFCAVGCLGFATSCDIAGESGAVGGTARAAVTAAPDVPEALIVDRDATVSMAPGEGVGIYVLYAAGGHWNIATTCDTRISGATCAFDVQIAPEQGAALSEVAGLDLGANDSLDLHDNGSIGVLASTTYGAKGVTFDTDPGAGIVLDVLLDGAPQPSFVYFVSGGAVREGVSTNPAFLVPSAP